MAGLALHRRRRGLVFVFPLAASPSRTRLHRWARARKRRGRCEVRSVHAGGGALPPPHHRVATSRAPPHREGQKKLTLGGGGGKNV